MATHTRYWLIALLMGVCLGGASHGESAGQKPVAVLLQEGIYQQETVGNLDKAIEIYQQVLAVAKETEQPAAQATYQLGTCYLQKGDKDKAVEYFQRVTTQYQKQDDVAKKARQQLQQLKPPPPYTQELSARITPDGTLHFKSTMRATNESKEPLKTLSFINSDFVHITTMRDEKDRLLTFTTTHENSHFRYRVTFNEPVLPGQTNSFSSEGTMSGLIKPVASVKDTFQYYMKHFPSAGRPTLRIETFLLPEGAELISTVPPGMIRTEKNGCIELHVEELIPADGSLTTAFQYKLPNAKPETISLFEKLPSNVLEYIGGKYGSISAEAKIKKLYSNAHIYVVDADFTMNNGGMAYYYNASQQLVASGIRLSGTSYPDQTLYDTAGQRMNTKIIPDQNRPNFYHIYWTPEQPVAPGQYFYYGWSTHGSKKLNSTNLKTYFLTMQNHFGQSVVETFFLVLPSGIGIVNQSEAYTSKETVSNFDVYYWSKELPTDTIHQVDLSLTKTDSAETNSQSAEELTAKGWQLWKDRKFAEAEKVFQQAVAKDPSMENAWNGLGWSQFNQGEPAAAQKAFEACVKLNPKHPAALNGLGWIAKGRGETKEAIGYWEKAVEAAPNATAALNGLATTHMELQNYDEAVKYYEMWLKAEPGNQDAKSGLEKTQQQQKLVKPAVQAAKEWLKLTDSGQYKKSWDEAAKFFQKAVTKEQWSQSLSAVRKPLGALKERNVGTATFTKQVPGAPDGQYVVIQFQTVFENKAAAVETVTPMLDSDGTWRVSGYYIK